MAITRPCVPSASTSWRARFARARVYKEGSEATCLVRNIPVRAFEDLIIQYIGEIGKHPEVIDAAIRSANDAKNKSIKPLKSKLAELDRRYIELSDAVRTYVDAAKKRGAKNIGDEFIQEAEKLAEEKRQVELEREKLKIDIQYRKKVVTDAKIIADSMKYFEKAIRKLSFDEQKELIRLLVKEITVNHFDPEKDKSPSGVGILKAKIRTKWYLVNITLYANDLFAGVPDEGVKSSYLDKVGSAGNVANFSAKMCHVLTERCNMKLQP